MKRFYYYLPLVLACFMIAGCATGSGIRFPSAVAPRSPVLSILKRPAMGLVYTHTIQPLDVNMNQTPIGEKKNTGDIKFFKLLNGYFSFMWDTNAIGDIAKENGIDVIYYAELETFSILGIWNQYTVHIYGN